MRGCCNTTYHTIAYQIRKRLGEKNVNFSSPAVFALNALLFLGDPILPLKGGFKPMSLFTLQNSKKKCKESAFLGAHAPLEIELVKSVSKFATQLTYK